MATNPVVPIVATGDLITAAHINNIRANLDRLDTEGLDLAGGTMSGSLVVGADPVGGAAGTRIVAVSTARGELISTQRTASVPNLVSDRAGPAAIVGDRFHVYQFNELSIGSVSVGSATSVVYNTTSDPRTKTPPPATRGIDDAAQRAQQLGRAAWRGEHIDPATGEPDGAGVWDFVSSHDVEDVAPYAVLGERDAVDGAGQPIWQEVSYGSLVPLLFAALADALDRIDVLEGAAG